MNLPYLEQDCDLTLRDGLELHYGVNPAFKENTNLVPAFYNHDIAHVLFGLDTSIENEGLTDFRCMFSTTWGVKKYISDYFKDPNAMKVLLNIFKEAGYIKSIFNGFKSFPLWFKVYVDSKKMYKKWEINPDDSKLDMKLSDLRSDYNITVINYKHL